MTEELYAEAIAFAHAPSCIICGHAFTAGDVIEVTPARLKRYEQGLSPGIVLVFSCSHHSIEDLPAAIQATLVTMGADLRVV